MIKIIAVIFSGIALAQAAHEKAIDKAEAARVKEYRKLVDAASENQKKIDALLKPWYAECEAQGKAWQPVTPPFYRPGCMAKQQSQQTKPSAPQQPNPDHSDGQTKKQP